jgi:hypothetical protein
MGKLFNLEVNGIFFSFRQSFSKRQNFSVFWSPNLGEKQILVLKITQFYPKFQQVAKKYRRMPKKNLSPNVAKSTYG